MHSKNILKIFEAASLVVTLFVGLSLPITFGVVSLVDTASSLESTARQSAGRAARYIFANEPMWEFQRVRLHDIIELPIADYAHYRQSIVSAAGLEVYADEHAAAWPVLSKREPIVVAGREVGKLIVETSLRQILIETAGMAVLSITIALLSLFIIHRWPLRMINQALADLAAEQQRTNAALHQLQKSDLALKSRSEQLTEAQKLGRIGDWRLTIASAEFFLSPVAASLLRLDDEASNPTLAGIKRMLLHGGAEKFERMIADVIRSRTAVSTDVEFLRGDNTTASIAFTCRPVSREDGFIAEIVGTIQDISERREAEAQLEKLAYFDPLTGLANRTLFKRELSETVRRSGVSGKGSALLTLDLDRFKEVNDTLGHAAGDELLRTVSHKLAAILNNDHFLARLGGDEFAVILTAPAEEKLAGAIALEVIKELSRPITLSQGEVRIGCSIGIAMVPQHGECPDELAKNADLALYRAKDGGRGRFAVFDPSMSDIVQQKMVLSRDLRIAATENQGLEAWFQPQIDLANGKAIGFEALMRWKHPTRGYVPPSEFIPIAESSSLIMDIGQWMMKESARTAKAWLDAGHGPFEIAVNLSAAQIWQTNIEEDVAAVLKDTGLPAHLLCIELTESLLADHTEGRVRRALTRLKALGVTLALDDFGTGFSSLGYLIQLPFDKLKIDRIFVSGASTSQKKQHVLEGIIALGHGLGMTVVAEGVEEPEDLALLRKLGCDQVQGYFFATPAPADNALAFALSNDRKLAHVA